MYDFAIIGGGPTGYAAAMYAGRLNLKTILYSGLPGGLIVTTNVVENYPGFASISGYEIFEKIRNHARIYNIDEKEEKIIEINNQTPFFTLKAESGHETTAKTVLFATGAKYRKLTVPGFKEFENKGIHYCALCDGFAYKNKIVAVIGGSDSAAKEALEITQLAKKVYIIYRGLKIHPEPINLTRVLQNQKIEIITETNVIEIIGRDVVKKVRLDKPYHGSAELILDGIFVAIGHTPQSELAKNIGVNVNQNQEIIINRHTETNIPGVFAAGDVTDTEFKQMIAGCGEGVMAAYKAFNFIEDSGAK